VNQFNDRSLRVANLFLWVFFGGIIATIVAFAIGLLTSDSTKLGNTGDFVSGVSGLFGAVIGAFAIWMYVHHERSSVRDAARAWQAKLRVEEALLMWDAMVRMEAFEARQLHGSRAHEMMNSLPQSKLKWVGPALERIRVEMERGFEVGLYRALASSTTATAEGCTVEQHYAYLYCTIVHDLQSKEPGLHMYNLVPDLYWGMTALTEQDILANLARPIRPEFLHDPRRAAAADRA
jgi:hypothetical protein